MTQLADPEIAPSTPLAETVSHWIGGTRDLSLPVAGLYASVNRPLVPSTSLPSM